MNLVNILKVGQKVYSPLIGNCQVISVDLEENPKYPIRVYCEDSDETVEFTAEGKYFTGAGECLLYPSKEIKDWNYHLTHFEPFEKVLVRDNDEEPWRAAFYDYLDETEEDYPHYTIGGTSYGQCIRFEGNEEKNGRLD